jgi:hypothetical protein
MFFSLLNNDDDDDDVTVSISVVAICGLRLIR